MNKTQRIIVVVGLLVLAVVLHFSFCDWVIRPSNRRDFGERAFLFIDVRDSRYYVTCVLLGIACPIVLIVGGVLLIVGMDKSKPEHTQKELPDK